MWRHNLPISFKPCLLWCLFFHPHPNHTPIKYRCLIMEKSNRITPPYLIPHLSKDTCASKLWGLSNSNLHVHWNHSDLVCNSMVKFHPRKRAKGHEAGNIFPGEAGLLNSNNLGYKALPATALHIYIWLTKCIKTPNNLKGAKTWYGNHA